MPQWDLAAVMVAIVAIPLAISPAVSNLIRDIYLAFLRTLWPASTRCEQLGWDDIHEGVLPRVQ